MTCKRLLMESLKDSKDQLSVFIMKRKSSIFFRSATRLMLCNFRLGLIGDLIECLVQRCFSYNTIDVRMSYEKLKSYLINPDVHKVVLIAHSQGGIIASMVLDKLLCELSQEMMAKLVCTRITILATVQTLINSQEIYTFGAAASHFSNPVTRLNSSPGKHPISKSKSHNRYPRVIKHIEHVGTVSLSAYQTTC